MKIVAIPDLHLDKKWKLTYGDSSILEELPLKLVTDILKTEQDIKEDFLLVFLGDVFNNSHPSFHYIFKFLSTIKNFTTIVLSGNHDIPKTEKISVMDYLADFTYIINRNEAIEIEESIYAIGWCDNQSIFESKLESIIKLTPSIIFLHAAFNNWDNEMDNVVTTSLITLAKKHNVKLISGHEHVFNVQKETLFHLGSIMPMNIGELGPKYYWTSTEGIKEISHGIGGNETDNIIFTKHEIDPQGSKPIVIRAQKTSSDVLKMEKRDLSIDILADFKEQALDKGFTEEFLKEYL